MDVVFLTEYGEGIGLGHIRRCQALADEIKEAKIIAYPDFDWIRNPPVFEPDTIIIIDSYLAKPSHYKYFSNTYKKVIAIDDYNRIDYGKCKVIQPDVFSGEDLFILRDSFKGVHFKVRPRVEKIIVSLGGSDYRNILKEILKMLKSIKNIDVTYFGSDNSISKDFIPGIMTSADIFISGFGQSMFELSYLGIPTIGIQIDIDQQRIANYFVNSGISKYNKWDDINLISNIQNQIEKDYQSYAYRKELSKKMKTIVDGNGKKRILEKIYE